MAQQMKTFGSMLSSSKSLCYECPNVLDMLDERLEVLGFELPFCHFPGQPDPEAWWSEGWRANHGRGKLRLSRHVILVPDLVSMAIFVPTEFQMDVWFLRWKYVPYLYMPTAWSSMKACWFETTQSFFQEMAQQMKTFGSMLSSFAMSVGCVR